MTVAVRGGLALLWMTLAAAHAHAYLVQVQPGDDGVLAVPPDALTLHFSMAVEARFSTFEVHRLDVDADGLPADLAAPTERERQRLNALAAQLAAQVLDADRDADAPGRADDGIVGLSDGDTVVTVGMRPDLPAGAYVVVWEVLAVDAHWTSGHTLLLIAGPTD